MCIHLDRLSPARRLSGPLLLASLILTPLILFSCDSSTQDTEPPAPPEVDAEAGNGEVHLHWQSSEAAAGYVIFQGTSSPAQTPIDTLAADQTSYHATDLENGTTYYFRIRAISETGVEGPFSEEVHAMPESPALGYRLEPAFSELYFERPTALMTLEGSPSLVYVAEQEGRIYVVENRSDADKAEQFVDLSDRVDVWNPRSAEGLLGFTLHPNFAENGEFFVLYTRAGPNGSTAYSQDSSHGPRTVLSRIQASSPRTAAPSSEEVLLTVNQPYQYHNGGQLAFGPDGYLYISLGDGGSVGDPDNRAQNVDSLHGSLLRIDVDRSGDGRPYQIPSTNPFAGSEEGRPEIYAYGFRNPWRFSFDPERGDLWAADVGQDDYEEINLVERGENYGWKRKEGTHCYEPTSGCDDDEFRDPIFEYTHAGDHHSGNHSITGGYRYRGDQLPDLQGTYIYGDFISGRIWSLSVSGEQAVENKLLVHTPLRLSTFGVDPEGRLLVTGVETEYEEGEQGQVYHLRPPNEEE